MSAEQRRYFRLLVFLVAAVFYFILSAFMSVPTVRNPDPEPLSWWHPRLVVFLSLCVFSVLCYEKIVAKPPPKSELTPDEQDLLNRFRRS